jgi:RNA polymerase sigma-70 factor (ECF subfamily)
MRRKGDVRAAASAYRKALALTTSEPERRYLERRLAELA